MRVRGGQSQEGVTVRPVMYGLYVQPVEVPLRRLEQVLISV